MIIVVKITLEYFIDLERIKFIWIIDLNYSWTRELLAEWIIP